MTLRRTSIAMQKQVLELERQGFQIRRICKILNISRNTVRNILRTKSPQSEQDLPTAPTLINWQAVATEHAKGVQLKTLWQELEPGISYWSFWRRFKQNISSHPAATIRLHHNPGEKIFFDFAEVFHIAFPFVNKVTLIFDSVIFAYFIHGFPHFIFHI